MAMRRNFAGVAGWTEQGCEGEEEEEEVDYKMLPHVKMFFLRLSLSACVLKCRVMFLLTLKC